MSIDIDNANALLSGSPIESVAMKESPTGADAPVIKQFSPAPSDHYVMCDEDELDCELTAITTQIDSSKCPRSHTPIFVVGGSTNPLAISSADTPTKAENSCVDSPASAYYTPQSVSSNNISTPVESVRASWRSPAGESPVMFHTKQYIKGDFGQGFSASLLSKLNFAPLHDVTGDNWSIWTVSNKDKVDYEQLKKMRSWQRFGRFPGMEVFNKQETLYNTINSMAAKHGNKFNFVPQSFVLPKQYQEFRKECKKAAAEKKPTGPWIFKSNSENNSNITIVNDFKDVSKLDSIKLTLQRKKMVISRYIANPLLIDGLKFDMRFYVLVTSVNPLRIFFFNDGIARFCTESFDANSSNPLAHITSTHMNAKSPKFDVSTDPNVTNQGHLRSVRAVLEVLSRNGIDSTKLMKRIHDITIKALIAAQSVVSEQSDKYIPYRRNCFQLFAVDVVVDDKLKPWMIDMSSNPSLEPLCHMEAPMKGKLIADMLRIVGLLNEQMPRHMDVPSGLSDSESIDVVCTLTENKNSGNFDLIYPAPNFQRYDQYFETPCNSTKIIVDNLARKSFKSSCVLERSASTYFRMYPTPVPHVPEVAPALMDRKSTFFRMYPIGGSP